MAILDSTSLGKIVNPDFAVTALHNTEPYGEFRAFVRLAHPDQCPSTMKVMEILSSDLFEVSIPCDQIEDVIEDGNVLRIELREYVSEGGFSS